MAVRGARIAAATKVVGSTMASKFEPGRVSEPGLFSKLIGEGEGEGNAPPSSFPPAPPPLVPLPLGGVPTAPSMLLLEGMGAPTAAGLSPGAGAGLLLGSGAGAGA